MCRFALMLLTIGATLPVVAPVYAVNPLPPITKPGLSVELVDFVQFPAATGSAPRDGINFLLEAPDDSGRLFVMDSRGGIRIIDNGVASNDIMLNLSLVPNKPGQNDVDIVVGNYGQQGLGGLTFHPDFATPGTDGFGKVYTAHSDNQAGKPTPDFPSPGSTTHHSVIIEWQVDPQTPNFIDVNSRRELLRIGQPFRDHNMQQIGFNPLAQPGDADYGMMYISMGDGGNNFPANPTDPYQNGQNPATPHGSILRIDPLGSNSANGNYGIPADNPFVGDVDLQHTLGTDESLTPGDETIDEIWAYGLRNPHRFSWDTGINGTGNMFISDIGQASIEEINLGIPGGNYGWRDREGTYATIPNNENNLNPLPANDDQYGYTYPVAMYDHDEGSAVVGGFVYRGEAHTQLQGMYIFGDLVNGRMFYTDAQDMLLGNQADVFELTLFHNGSEQTLLQILGNAPRADLRFGTDNDGEIYVIAKRTGEIFRLLPETLIDGDLNADGFVGVDDLGIVLQNWNLQVPARDPRYGDSTGDGFVGVDDLNIILLNWNNGTPPSESANIPEPGTLCLLGMASASLLRRVKRQAGRL